MEPEADGAVEQQCQYSNGCLEDAVVGGSHPVLVLDVVIEALFIGVLADSGYRDDHKQQGQCRGDEGTYRRKGSERIDVLYIERCIRPGFVRCIIDAQQQVEQSGQGQQDYLCGKGSSHGEDAEHTADKEADGAGNVLDGCQPDQITSPVVGKIDDMVGHGGVYPAGEYAGKHPAAYDLQLTHCRTEDNLAYRVAEAAQEDDFLCGNIAAEPAPERGKEEVHGHHCGKRNTEHRTVQIPFNNQGRCDRMGKTGSHVEDECNDKEYQQSVFSHRNYCTQGIPDRQ